MFIDNLKCDFFVVFDFVTSIMKVLLFYPGDTIKKNKLNFKKEKFSRGRFTFVTDQHYGIMKALFLCQGRSAMVKRKSNDNFHHSFI